MKKLKLRILFSLGLAQAMEFFPFVGSFFAPAGRKKNLQKKKSTMLPFVLSLSKGRRKLPVAYVLFSIRANRVIMTHSVIDAHDT
jgi:hypothetical protein